MPRNDLIQVRRDTAANWAAVNPVLAAGEQGLATDTGAEKIGDGVTAWNALPMRQSGTYAANTLRGRRCVGWGDSITAGGSGTSYYDQMVFASKGKLFSVKNAGAHGERSGPILARFGTDVAPYSPDYVFIMSGTNDLGDSGYTRAISVANLDSMISLVRGIGATPVVLSIPPSTVSRAKVAGYNRAYANLCQRRGVRYVDVYTVLTDPSTGTYRTSYSVDGVHPSGIAVAAMTPVVLSQVADLIGGAAMLCVDNSDSANLLGEPLFLTDTNADGIANSWSGVNTVAGITNDLVTGDGAIQGSWQRLTMSAVSNNYRTIQQTVNTGFAVGDVIRVSARVKASGITASGAWSFGYLTGSGGTLNYIVQNCTSSLVTSPSKERGPAANQLAVTAGKTRPAGS